MRQIKEHPEYLVTVDGKIFSLKTMRFLKLHFNGSNYLRVHIKNKFYSVHRLVAQTYLPNPENKEQVNHMDGDKTNNMLCNLEWATRQENINYSRHNMMGPKKTYATGRAFSNTKWSSIYPQIMELLGLGTKPVDIASKLNIPSGSIYQIIKLIKKRNN